VWDDSGATITSDLTTISKRVVAREDVQKDLAPGVNPCPDTGYTDDTVGDFRLGDTVCFELRVNFPSSIDVRNPVVTDFLTNGLTYAGMDVRTATPVFDEVISADGKRIDWKLGSLGEGGDLYIPRGHVFVAHVWATVDAPSNGTVQDKPENLMKYRQQNVHGELYFLRDQADILVDPEMQLLKGVESVLANGGVVWEPERDAASEYLENGEDFLSNRDGIQVVEGETVRFRVDLFALPYD